MTTTQTMKLTETEWIAVITALREKARRWEKTARRVSNAAGAAEARAAARRNRDLARRIEVSRAVHIALPATVRDTVDVTDWRVRPADGNTDAHPCGVWVIDAGDYADEGEPDLHITVEAEHSRDVAKFIVQAAKETVR